MPEDPTGSAVRNLFHLRQLENDLAVRAHRLLLDLFEDMAAQVSRFGLSRGELERIAAGTDLGTIREQQLALFVDEAERLTGRTFDEIQEIIETEGARIGLQQAEFAAGQLRSSIGSAAGSVEVDIGIGGLTEVQTRAILTEEPFQGEVLGDWTDHQAKTTVAKVRRQVQLGMAQNETTDEIVRRIRGRQAGFLRFDPETGDFVAQGTPGARVRPRFQGGVLSTTTRQTEALVRTAVNHVSVRSHIATYEANQDVTESYTYTVTLDSRTSDICISLSGNTYRYDDPNRVLPPQHFGCRSVPTPNVKWEELGIEAPEPGTRASADGQVSAETTYSDWLRDQPKETQVEILGEQRANLFRANRINLKQLVTGDSRRRTVDELRELAGIGS